MKKLLIIFYLFFLNSISYSTENRTAYFAGGCFWCMEAAFDKIEGVVSVVSGYSGGNVENPTYEQVLKGKTGHIETVKITYNPEKITYLDLLKNFGLILILMTVKVSFVIKEEATFQQYFFKMIKKEN